MLIYDLIYSTYKEHSKTSPTKIKINIVIKLLDSKSYKRNNMFK